MLRYFDAIVSGSSSTSQQLASPVVKNSLSKVQEYSDNKFRDRGKYSLVAGVPLVPTFLISKKLSSITTETRGPKTETTTVVESKNSKMGF